MRLAGFLIICSSLLPATTLEKLSVDDMILKSTEIVCGKVTATTSVMRGTAVYTKYRVQVTDTLKGDKRAGNEMDVFVPGGKFGSTVQQLPGSPKLGEGQDYMLFLWTSRSGLTQVIGLSQGLFVVKRNPKGEPVLTRNASDATMLDSSGQVVEDTPVSLRLREMVDRIHRSLAGASK